MKRERELSERQKDNPSVDLPSDHPLRKLISRFRKRSERNLFSPQAGADLELGETASLVSDGIQTANKLPTVSVEGTSDGLDGNGNSGVNSILSRWGSVNSGNRKGSTPSVKLTLSGAPEESVDSSSEKKEEERRLLCVESNQDFLIDANKPAPAGSGSRIKHCPPKRPPSKWGKLLGSSIVQPETVDQPPPSQQTAGLKTTSGICTDIKTDAQVNPIASRADDKKIPTSDEKCDTEMLKHGGADVASAAAAEAQNLKNRTSLSDQRSRGSGDISSDLLQPSRVELDGDPALSSHSNLHSNITPDLSIAGSQDQSTSDRDSSTQRLVCELLKDLKAELHVVQSRIHKVESHLEDVFKLFAVPPPSTPVSWPPNPLARDASPPCSSSPYPDSVADYPAKFRVESGFSTSSRTNSLTDNTVFSSASQDEVSTGAPKITVTRNGDGASQITDKMSKSEPEESTPDKSGSDATPTGRNVNSGFDSSNEIDFSTKPLLKRCPAISGNLPRFRKLFSQTTLDENRSIPVKTDSEYVPIPGNTSTSEWSGSPNFDRRVSDPQLEPPSCSDGAPLSQTRTIHLNNFTSTCCSSTSESNKPLSNLPANNSHPLNDTEEREKLLLPNPQDDKLSPYRESDI